MLLLLLYILLRRFLNHLFLNITTSEIMQPSSKMQQVNIYAKLVDALARTSPQGKRLAAKSAAFANPLLE